MVTNALEEATVSDAPCVIILIHLRSASTNAKLRSVVDTGSTEGTMSKDALRAKMMGPTCQTNRGFIDES